MSQIGCLLRPRPTSKIETLAEELFILHLHVFEGYLSAVKLTYIGNKLLKICLCKFNNMAKIGQTAHKAEPYSKLLCGSVPTG